MMYIIDVLKLKFFSVKKTLVSLHQTVLNFFQNQSRSVVLKYFLLSSFFNEFAFAQDPSAGGGGRATDIATALLNFSRSFPAIERLLSGASYIIGIIFAIRALYYFKIYGELRTMMSTNASLRPPLTYLIVSAAFIFFPTTIDIMLNTFFGTPTLAEFPYQTGRSDSTNVIIGVVIAVIQIIGYIAFIRGWMIIAHTAQQSSRDTLGKGLTHIIGGILAINIVGTKNILWNTFGFG